jgi:hypothetical protein
LNTTTHPAEKTSFPNSPLVVERTVRLVSPQGTAPHLFGRRDDIHEALLGLATCIVCLLQRSTILLGTGTPLVVKT